MSTPNVQLPTIGVVIPNYNHKEYLQAAINSVLIQDYPQKVVAIVDDKSTDNSEEILKSLALKQVNHEWWTSNLHGLILFYSQNKENMGPSFSRNRAIDFLQQSCHLFSFLDSDDYYLPGYLSKCAWKFIENPEHVGMVYTDNFNLNTKSGEFNREYRESFDYERLVNHNMICSKFMVSKLALAKVGVFCNELRLAEDLDLSLRIGEQFVISHIPEPLCVLRKTGLNTDVINGPEKWNEAWKLVGERLQRRKQGIVN